MKPLIPLLALGSGVGAVSLAAMLQMNPYLFTHMGSNPPGEATESAPADQKFEIPMPFAKSSADAEPMRIAEVKIVSRLHSGGQFRAIATRSEPAPRMIAPPCTDGEYRMIEEHRGVRLLCPGASL
jgi:hypothetical protein